MKLYLYGLISGVDFGLAVYEASRGNAVTAVFYVVIAATWGLAAYLMSSESQ